MLPFLAVVNNAAMNIGVHVSFQISVCAFFEYLPRSVIPWACGSSIFNFLCIFLTVSLAVPIYLLTNIKDSL